MIKHCKLLLPGVPIQIHTATAITLMSRYYPCYMLVFLTNIPEVFIQTFCVKTVLRYKFPKLTLKLPGPAAGVCGSLTVTVA